MESNLCCHTIGPFHMCRAVNWVTDHLPLTTPQRKRISFLQQTLPSKTSQLEMRSQMLQPPPCCNFYLWWSCPVIALVTTAAANLCEQQPHHIFKTLFYSLPPHHLAHTFFLFSLLWCVLSFRVGKGVNIVVLSMDECSYSLMLA